MDKKNLRMSIMNEISALQDAQEVEVKTNGKESEELKVMIRCWERAYEFLDEENPYPIPSAFVIGHMDYSDAMDLAGFFTRRGNKVTVERTGEGLTQDWYRIKVEGDDGVHLRRQFDA